MSYPDHEYYITFLFERLEDFKASVDAPQPQTYGRPKSYADEKPDCAFGYIDAQGYLFIQGTT